MLQRACPQFSMIPTCIHIIITKTISSTNLQFPCPKKMQINLTGFLNGKNARLFMGELWEHLLSAQASENGIPESFMQQKKDEIKKRIVRIHAYYPTNPQ